MATARKTTSAARITGSRDRPNLSLPPFLPLFGILILMATLLTRHRQNCLLVRRWDAPKGWTVCCSLCRFPARSFHHYVMSGGDVFHCTAMPANKKKPAVHAGL